MKTTIRKALGLAGLLCVAAGSGMSSAQYYGGLNFNFPKFSAAVEEVDAFERGFFVTNTALDDRRVRYGLKLGYQFAPHLAVVTRYADFERRGTASPLVRSYGLDLDSQLPLTARFSVSGSAGIARIRNETNFGGGFYPDLLASYGSRAYTAGRLGLGMQYQVTNSLGLRFDVEKYRALPGSSLGDLDADHVSFGVTFRF